MYENEIEALELAAGRLPNLRHCLSTAVSILRAAQPKGEEAEHEYCYQVSVPETYEPMTVGQLTDLLVRERAAARAPLQARINELEARLAGLEK